MPDVITARAFLSPRTKMNLVSLATENRTSINKTELPMTQLIMPKMGESVAEATILKWLKKEGDRIEADEPVLEIATDKVDSEVPSPAAGILSKRMFEEGQVVKVGQVIAMIAAEGETSTAEITKAPVNATTPSSNGKHEVNVAPAQAPLVAEIGRAHV